MPRRFLHVLLFLLGLFGTAAGICSLDLVPFNSWTRPKALHLLNHPDRYDTLFVGSSRVHCGVVPQVFDQRMAELGVPTRSYNFGFAGLRQHDFDVLIDWILAQKLPRLRRVVVELYAFEQGERGGNWMTDLEVEMHPLRDVPARVQSVLLSRYGPVDKAEILWFLGAHTVVRALRIGQGVRILGDVLTRLRGEPLTTWSVADEGYMVTAGGPDTPPQRLAQHKEWVEHPDVAAAMLAERRQDVAPARLRGGFNHDWVRAMEARLRAAGIEPVFVVMPVWSMNFWGRDGVDEWLTKTTVIELDRPQLHPQLYDFALWYDNDHMMRPGSEILSRHLADQIAGFTAAWTRDGSALELRVAGQSAAVRVGVMVSAGRGLVPFGDELAAGITSPVLAGVELQRDAAGAWVGRVDGAPLPHDVPLFAQYALWQGEVVTAVGPVVRIAPRP